MNSRLTPYSAPSPQRPTPAARQPILARHLIQLRDLEARITGILSAPRPGHGEFARLALDAIEAEAWHRRHHLDRELAELGVVGVRAPHLPGAILTTVNALASAAALAVAAAGVAYGRFEDYVILTRDVEAAGFAASARGEIATAAQVLEGLIPHRA